MNDVPAEMIRIEVACALPDRQALVTLSLRAGATAMEAVRQSELLRRFPELDAASPSVGIFGRRVEPGQILADGDRVELYRPLLADPKQARRRRARR